MYLVASEFARDNSCTARGKMDQSKPTNYVTVWIAGDN